MKYPCLIDKRFCKTPIKVTIYDEETDEYNAPLIAATYSGFCNYQDKAKTVFLSDKRFVQASAQAFFVGDIAPEAAIISGGEVEVFGEKRHISQGMKARNPDGTVNYTRLDLL